jgi:hypothetical protein
MDDLGVFDTGQGPDGNWFWTWDGPAGQHLRSASVFDSEAEALESAGPDSQHYLKLPD